MDVITELENDIPLSNKEKINALKLFGEGLDELMNALKEWEQFNRSEINEVR